MNVVAVLTGALWTTGCGGPRSETPASGASATATTPAPAPNPKHEHEAPRGGTLVELGDEFAHIELVRDRPGRALTVYVLDGEAEQAVRIPQKSLTIRLESPVARTLALIAVANPLTGETVGDSSQFTATGDVFGSDSAVRGVIDVITVRGQPFKEVPFAVGR